MIRTLVRGTGQLFITAGLVILLFAAFEMWGTGLATRQAQHQLYAQLQQQWAHAPHRRPGGGGEKAPLAAPDPRLHHGIALLYIPPFGKSWFPRVVVEGVSLADLARGPGHYPGSAMPGQVGNFAVAGHRATHGNGFMQLNTLRPGDPIVVETRTHWYTYRVTGSEIVLPTETDVVAPVPHHPDATPTKRLITLTTCDPWWSATHRLIVHGILVDSHRKTVGYRPAAL